MKGGKLYYSRRRRRDEKAREDYQKLLRQTETKGVYLIDIIREGMEEAGVSLRSIQMYEQRNKDINRAQTESVVRLARALGCQVENLLED